MAELNDAARDLLTSGKLAHCATVNADGTPQMSGGVGPWNPR